ncbi:MAG: hypothetical protein BM556_03320 [Bacteriovorax sp. MedPE-SWde]|nr:MAG: hypothetical protein BM556_03320 [Bacteriovorax sp. MedPE-SWde]
MDPKQISRRNFIKSIMLSSICGGLPLDILAKSSEPSFNYIQINFAGGPARWLFDNPIAPKKSSKFGKHQMIVNSFDNAGSSANISALNYKTENISGWQMPYFWKNELSLDGKTIQASSLLDNCLIVRGCHMRNDGHSLNNRKLSAPTPGHLSIPGMLADNMKAKIFPAVNLVGDSGVAGVAGGTFRSVGQAIQIDTPQNHKDPFSYLIKPFLSLGNMKGEWSGLIKSELGDNFKNDYFKMQQRYNNLVKKYKLIIESNIVADGMVNIGERKVQSISNFTNGNFTEDHAKYLNHDYLVCNNDMRTMLSTAKIEGLAEQFATTEVLVTEGLCGNISINVNTISNLYYENSYKKDSVFRKINGIGDTKFTFKSNEKSYTGSKKENSFQLDSHDTGLLPNLFLNYALYKSVSACMAQLKLSLIKSKQYEKTLIHLASEFDRDPRPDCSGSEHGWNGHISSFYSGAIKGLKVIGNTYIQSPGESYYKENGTWGQGAPVKELGDRPIVYGNIASSIADILGVKTPSENDKPIFYKEKGIIKTLIDEVDNV